LISVSDLIALFRRALSEKWGYIWGTAGKQWTALKQENLEKTTDADRALGRAYGKKWIGHKVADCSGLFSWAFRQLGGTMYHGSNTMFLKWCAYKGELKAGQRTDRAALKPGTACSSGTGRPIAMWGCMSAGTRSSRPRAQRPGSRPARSAPRNGPTGGNSAV